MKFWSVIASLFLLSAAAVQGGILAQFKMNNDLGTIDVELFEQDKPVTVSNFVAYVKSGAWHDSLVQRWHPGFVIQSGTYFLPHDPNLLTPLSSNRFFISPFPTIPFEAAVGRRFSNTFGTIAMARGSDTNSASSNWFFNLDDNVSLDTAGAGYTVFGRTLRGTNTLNRFNATPGTTNLYALSDSNLPPGSYLPAYSTDGVKGFWVNLDITLLTVEIARVTGGNEISWNSVEGRPNIVEFTRTIPAVWQPVATVTGTGARMSVINDPVRDSLRHYRVRIDYSN